MTELPPILLASARDLHLNLAGAGLTPAMAKLYSQRTRLDAGLPGLTHWRSDEAAARLDDAVRLVQGGLLKKVSGDRDWQGSVRRAAELLEWLSHPSFGLEGLPTTLLSAGAYQVAGYPAMSSSLLERVGAATDQSRLLTAFLTADFPTLLKELCRFWEHSEISPETSLVNGAGDATPPRIEDSLVSELAGVLGVISAHARWGQEGRLSKALQKLDAISSVFLHSGDSSSWLLSRLVFELATQFSGTMLRPYIKTISETLSSEGDTALELYARLAYIARRSLLWPSQVRGIGRLLSDESFALCTPTGSGKTTVAELGILQSLFSDSATQPRESGNPLPAPLAIYLVPSRALAAEVEAKLSRVLQKVAASHPITVTGLYGGTDWGATDAWLTVDERTVLICTYEKGEALLRFLGPLFLNRVRLIVLDEAHAVQFDGRYPDLVNAESRSLRLEALVTRLLAYTSGQGCRVIALSAMAGETRDSLASWVRASKESTAESSNYRSTRQLIGRLECLPGHRFEIRYDILDGSRLRFTEQGQSDSPYIPGPFPPFPAAQAWNGEGPEKRLRPYLFWAAMQLVGTGAGSERASVLVFVPQQIGGYLDDLLTFLESDWVGCVPEFFAGPTDPLKTRLWQRCLAACADYFTKGSREYRLLARGVAVHHGKMPRLLSRLLVEVIEERIVHLVISTSTLAEGMNLPFEVLLIPTLRRGEADIAPREIANLAGRTGRPGVAIEGKTLVLLPRPAQDYSSQKARRRYDELVNYLANAGDDVDTPGPGSSPLAELLRSLRAAWELLPKGDVSQFDSWLEHVQPIGSNHDASREAAVRAVDALDSVLLSILVELEQVAGLDLEPAALEERLTQVWRKTYAYYASQDEAVLGRTFAKRGVALTTNVYPLAQRRRQLYKTGLPPRSGDLLTGLFGEVKEHLSQGFGYSVWDRDARFQFIKDLIATVRRHPKFKAKDALGRRKTTSWEEVLFWWLNPVVSKGPSPNKVSDWYDFVYGEFDYRFNWGLSSLLAMALDEVHGGGLRSLTLEDWPASGLPWIGFWVKDLIVWGTLDPVAAYLLARRRAWTRSEAESMAEDYYASSPLQLPPNDRLAPNLVRKWAEHQLHGPQAAHGHGPPPPLRSRLLRDFAHATRSKWRVLPVMKGNAIVWFDPAGFPLATSEKPAAWNNAYAEQFDFLLKPSEEVVVASAFP